MALIKKSFGGKVFDICNTIFLILLGIITFYPFWYEVCISFSKGEQALRGGLFFWPKDFTIEAYKVVLGGQYIWQAFRNSFFVTIVGTVIGVMITASLAYPMAKRMLPGKKILTVFILATLLFHGGIIPTYLTVRKLGLVNSLWALILLGAANPFNVMVMRNFFANIPEEIEESAFIDGASPIRIFTVLILPLSMPVIATISLWLSVFLWNDFFRGVMFLNDRTKFVLPVLLREIIQSESQIQSDGRMTETITQTITASTVVIALIPILCVYPFLQKYFVKGVMVGSVKG